MKQKNNPSQKQNTETNKGLCSRSPLKLRNLKKGKELLGEKDSHKLDSNSAKDTNSNEEKMTSSHTRKSGVSKE